MSKTDTGPRLLRRSVNVFDDATGYHTYEAGTPEGDIPEEHLEMITNPKAWVSRETMDEDFGVIPEGWTREDFRRAAEANSDRTLASEDDDDEDGDGLDKKTVPQLVELANEEGIELGDAHKKADILQVIRDVRDAG